MLSSNLMRLIRRGGLIGAGIVLPLAAFAQQDTTKVEKVATNTLDIVNTLVTVVFILAVLVFGWGVVKYITSAGDPEGEKAARGFLWWGVIGMAVLALVFGIIKYAATFFGVGQERGTINVPTVKDEARTAP